MADLDLDSIEARANAATEGPWLAHDERSDLREENPDVNPMWVVAHMEPNGVIWVRDIADIGGGEQDETDAEFIAHARTDVPALVAALREARAEVERLRTLADDNWRSLEREATEHARTQTAADRLLAEAAAHLRAIGVPKRGEPLSEGEQARFSAAIERGLRKRAEDLAEDLEARGLDLAASNAALTAERDDWRRRYEALRDGVTGLCDDPMSDWTALMGPCEKHTAQSGFMRKDDLRAVVARVEGDES